MKRLIIVGSPRSNGHSAHLAEMLFEACIDECPDDEVSLAPVSELEISACIGCNGCKEPVEGEHVCVFDDDAVEVREIMAEVDELIVVSPVYFSGAPAPLKALLDRFQPSYWTWERGGVRRPMTLHVIGEGGDPNGYDALISEVRSAGAVAGFTLERVVDWVGKIDESGQITADGEEYVPEGTAVKFARISAEDVENVHVIHEENLRQARKAKKKQRAAEKKSGQSRADGGGANRNLDRSDTARGDGSPARNDADGGQASGRERGDAAGRSGAQASRPQLNIHSTGKGKPRNGNGGKGGNRG